jgi:hypothetical protein
MYALRTYSAYLFVQIWNVYPCMVLFTTFVQTKFRPYSLYCFSKYKIFKQKFNVLNTVFSKQNISCFEIRWPRPIWSVNVVFMHKCFSSEHI